MRGPTRIAASDSFQTHASDTIGSMMKNKLSVCVFCSAQEGLPESAQLLATELGEALARADYRLVYGGGNRGLMGLTARSALREGGEVYGVIPHWLQSREGPALELTKLDLVDSMAERKDKMIAASDAFIALPGGIGTLDELTDVLTLFDLHKHQKPMILCDADGFWRPLVDWFAHAKRYGVIREHLLDGLTVVDSLPAAMQCLALLNAKRQAD